MSKRKSDSAAATSLTELRQRIDELDRELLKQMNLRAELVVQIGKLKREQAKFGYDPQREREILARLVEANPGPLEAAMVAAIFRELISGCRSLAAPRRVAYLGPEFSYSHIAAIQRFGQAAELIPVGSIKAVFEEVISESANYGLVPMENSTDGRIADTLNMFARTPTRICGEVQLRIHHNLLAACPRGEITDVYSKPQALSQCRDWLSKHLPHAQLHETPSTTAAAEIAAEKKGAAAVASRQAGVNYGLDVAAANVEDNANNITRFAVIGHQADEPTARDKTALIFEVDHKPGALADAMNLFKRNELNLTWIESFPIPERPSEYLFFVELEGHESDEQVKKALASLKKQSLRLDVLGSYARTEVVD